LSEERTIAKRKKTGCVPHIGPSVKSRADQLALRKEMIRWALIYVDLGCPIIPLWSVDENGKCVCHRKKCYSPGRHPHRRLVPKGVEDATKDREKIKLWFATNDLNIGILTGPESGLLVLDIDPDQGGNESLVTLESRYGKFDAIEAVTGGGGKHLVMQYPKGRHIPYWVNELAPGLVVRGTRDYIVACPSRHTRGGRYEWKDEPTVIELPLCPEWLATIGTHSRDVRETTKQGWKRI
jgi:hypothetical protein